MRRPDSEGFWRTFKRPLVWSVATALLLNLLFLGLMLLAVGNPTVIAERVRAAFVTHELGLVDYLPGDSRRGWHQYNDCNVLQMLSNPHSSRLEQAVAPTIFKADEEFNHACPVLRALIVDNVDPNTLYSFRYARYWHGYSVPAGLGLQIMGLRELRLVLSATVWVAIGVLAFSASRAGPYIRRAGLSIAAVAATLWAVPFFAPSLTHGPGDALLLLALSIVAAQPKIASKTASVMPYAAGFGAAVVFLEMLTGQFPTAAAWLAALTLAASRDEQRSGSDSAVGVIVAAVFAFGLGGILTVMMKQLLAFLLVEPAAGEQFMMQLRQYTSIPASDGDWFGILLPFTRLVRRMSMLTFGNVWAAYCLVAISGILWLYVVVNGLRERRSTSGQDGLLLFLMALIPVVWVLLMPRHTYIHATFMIRIFIVPLSLLPLVLYWPDGKVMGVERPGPSLADK